MNLPKGFGEYVRQGVIRKCSIDKSRARFLFDETEKSLRGLSNRIKVMSIDDDNANSVIKDCYDIIMELIRAKLLLDGYCSSGQFAHEAEISYLRELNFSDNEISFMNELRYFRNSVTYYGKILDVIYAHQVVEFTQRICPKLRIIVHHHFGL